MLALFFIGVFETFLFPSNPSLHQQFNPGHLSDKKWQVSIGAEERFGIAELRTWNTSFRLNNYRIGIQSLGTDFYRENAMEISCGFPVGKDFSAGASTTLLNYWIKDYASRFSYSVRLGGTFLAPRIEAGIWIGNINVPKFSETDCLPLTYSTHARFAAAQHLNFYFAAMGMDSEIPFFDIGLALIPTRSVQVLAGLNTENFLFEYGMALALGKFNLQYSGNNHRQLGLSHEFVIAFSK